MVDIENYGIYKIGMTGEEIKEYLKDRYNSKEGNLGIRKRKYLIVFYKKFNKIAGTNTCATIICPCCKKQIILMYRHDVERFANVLFEGIKTYFD